MKEAIEVIRSLVEYDSETDLGRSLRATVRELRKHSEKKTIECVSGVSLEVEDLKGIPEYNPKESSEELCLDKFPELPKVFDKEL